MKSLFLPQRILRFFLFFILFLLISAIGLLVRLFAIRRPIRILVIISGKHLLVHFLLGHIKGKILVSGNKRKRFTRIGISAFAFGGALDCSAFAAFGKRTASG